MNRLPQCTVIHINFVPQKNFVGGRIVQIRECSIGNFSPCCSMGNFYHHFGGILTGLLKSKIKKTTVITVLNRSFL